MPEEPMVTCWDCTPPTEWKPQQISGHRNKHRNEEKKAAQANDSSSVPGPIPTIPDVRVNQDGETSDRPDYEPPQVPPVVIHRPKVADALVPWLSIAGYAIAQRNAYDGDVMSRGIPGFVNALDDVAQTNDSLYRLLEGIKAGDSPNFRLALCTLAIIVPILANHRPESKALRNLVGGLRFVPGTDIPRLPKAPDVTQEADDVAEDMTQKMREAFEQMSDEDRVKIEESINSLPADLLTKMVNFQTAPSMMEHPETVTVSDDGPPVE
jgi:hypothetical protein